MRDARNQANLADLVRRAAGRGPALCWHDRSLSWSELDASVDAAAAGLRRLALRASGPHPARVAIALPNSPEFAVAYFGVLRAGLVAVPVNPGYTARELRHVLSDSGAGALLSTGEVAAAVAPLRADLPELRHAYALGDNGGGSGAAEPFEALLAGGAGAPDGTAGTGGEDLAVLLYTSGTAGSPKGAMLSHRALLANHEQLAAVEPPIVGPDDIVLLAVPLFHSYGLNSGLGAVAYHGATGVLVERFDPADTLELIARRRVTVVVGVPPMYIAWSLLPDLAEAMATVRLAISGASPLDQAAAARFTAATRRPVSEGYGLTETAPVLTSTLSSPAPKRGSIGRPIPGVELRLVSAGGDELWRAGDVVPRHPDSDDDDDDEFMSSGTASPGTDPGEIVVRGANLFSGYWPDAREGPDEDGWWATGDVAYADADGDLFLVDRLGELVLVSGFNVYPTEVEQVLEAHEGVAEAAVLGIPHPYTGQTVKAYVVRAAGPAGAGVTVEALLRHCERNLARFKCPTAVEFVPELPHTATGKVRKVALRPRRARLTLLTRQGCHLCDDAREALARVADATGESWTEVDVDSDPEMQREYGDRVPVVLLDGREHGYWRVEEERLLRDLGR
ncbi:MAG TPA: AMP-binding protein [Micromonosporaceae bacterium]|nr:AMP-binding protein [Micromonosporaceae bacterium]